MKPFFFNPLKCANMKAIVEQKFANTVSEFSGTHQRARQRVTLFLGTWLPLSVVLDRTFRSKHSLLTFGNISTLLGNMHVMCKTMQCNYSFFSPIFALANKLVQLTLISPSLSSGSVSKLHVQGEKVYKCKVR